MTDRHTIHKSEFNGFKKFLNDSGISYRDGKGDWELIQVNLNGKWQAIYNNLKSDHFSIPHPLYELTVMYKSYKRKNKMFKRLLACLQKNKCLNDGDIKFILSN